MSISVFQGVSSDDKHYQFIVEKITANSVVVFSKTSCNFCKMAIELLDETGVNYAVENIDGRDDCSDLQDMFESMTGEKTVRVG